MPGHCLGTPGLRRLRLKDARIGCAVARGRGMGMDVFDIAAMDGPLREQADAARHTPVAVATEARSRS
jgi:hypothetical protein